MIQKHIGYGGDLLIPSSKYMRLTGGASSPEVKSLISFGDLFLLHDKVSFRADQSTIYQLFNSFSIAEVTELVKTNRISFYLPRYSPFYNENLSEEIGKSLKASFIFLSDNTNTGPERAVKLVFDNLELPEEREENFEKLKSEMGALFYKYGIQRDSFFNSDTCFAFDQAIEKIRELWSCGIFSTAFDDQVLYFLEICNKASFLKESNFPIADFESYNYSITDDLHALKNIPSLSEIILKSEKPVHEFINIVNSSEADSLRKWIQSAKGKDIDVRELYNSTLSKLPSKKMWVDWTRFGSVTAVSGILGTILTTDPVVGGIIGGVAGALDKAYGDKLIDKASSGYNPDAWFNFMQSKT